MTTDDTDDLNGYDEDDDGPPEHPIYAAARRGATWEELRTIAFEQPLEDDGCESDEERSIRRRSKFFQRRPRLGWIEDLMEQRICTYQQACELLEDLCFNHRCARECLEEYLARLEDCSLYLEREGFKRFLRRAALIDIEQVMNQRTEIEDLFFFLQQDLRYSAEEPKPHIKEVEIVSAQDQLAGIQLMWSKAGVIRAEVNAFFEECRQEAECSKKDLERWEQIKRLSDQEHAERQREDERERRWSWQEQLDVYRDEAEQMEEAQLRYEQKLRKEMLPKVRRAFARYAKQDGSLEIFRREPWLLHWARELMPIGELTYSEAELLEALETWLEYENVFDDEPIVVDEGFSTPWFAYGDELYPTHREQLERRKRYH